MASQPLFIGTNGHVASIRVEDGSETWRTKLAADGMMGATAHQDVCVLEHDGKVFAGCMGHLFCLDGATGSVLWHNPLKGLNHNDVTLAIAGKSIQFVSTHSSS